jgi:hypothetical protein
MELSNPRWDTLLVFRDYLRAHPEAVRAYSTIKRALLSSKDDIKAYTMVNCLCRRDNSQARMARSNERAPHGAIELIKRVKEGAS